MTNTIHYTNATASCDLIVDIPLENLLPAMRDAMGIKPAQQISDEEFLLIMERSKPKRRKKQ